MANEPQRLGPSLFERPRAPGSSAALPGGLEHHGHAHGGQQLKQPREPFGVMQFSRLGLDEPSEQLRQLAAEGVHVDRLIDLVILRAHCHALIVLQLAERFFGVARSMMGEQDLLVWPLVAVGDEDALAVEFVGQLINRTSVVLVMQSIGAVLVRVVVDFEHTTEVPPRKGSGFLCCSDRLGWAVGVGAQKLASNQAALPWAKRSCRIGVAHRSR